MARHDGLGRFIVVAGPTASGKSALAVDLAEAFVGVVINADAMQVYRGLKVLTARPDAAALARAPHRLYGVLAPQEPCNVARWRAMALRQAKRAHDGGRLPILTGGTGLYLRTFEDNISPLPPVPEGVRNAARRRHAELGAAAFHAALSERDPATAARLHPNDSQRVIRAWEVLEATGKPLSSWQQESGPKLTGRRLRFVLMPAKEALHAACDARFHGMMARGALAEVRRLRARSLDPALPVTRAIGVPELGRHLDGEITLERAVALAQQATRRYAKRQLTWLRTQMIGRPADESGAVMARVALDTWAINAQYSESLRPEIFNILREFLLTPPP